MARKNRKPFNAAGPFVARRRFLFNGEYTTPEDQFEEEGCSVRRLRQLYDNRLIDMAPDGFLPKNHKAVEERIAKIETIEWRNFNRTELIEFVREETGILCKSKKEATETMERWEAK